MFRGIALFFTEFCNNVLYSKNSRNKYIILNAYNSFPWKTQKPSVMPQRRSQDSHSRHSRKKLKAPGEQPLFQDHYNVSFTH